MRLILFDIDGTLLSAQGAGRRALNRAIEECYGLRNALDGVQLDGKTDPAILREAMENAGLPMEARGEELLHEVLEKAYCGFLEEELSRVEGPVVLPGVQELLERIRVSGQFVVGLATGNVRRGAEAKLRRAGLADRFSFGGFGCDSENRTEVVRTAIGRGRIFAKCIPEQVFVVGDTPRDILHGREAGARTVAVATGSFRLEELLSYQPDLAVPDLDASPALWSVLTG